MSKKLKCLAIPVFLPEPPVACNLWRGFLLIHGSFLSELLSEFEWSDSIE